MVSKSDIKYIRGQVKLKLIEKQRRVIKGKGYVAICPYCDFRLATDMHEALVKRSDVQGWPDEKKILIFCEENCVILCHRCHMEYGQTSHMTEWFVDYRERQGYDLKAWLRTLPFVVTPKLGYVGGHDD